MDDPRLKVIASVEAETSIASCLVVMPLFRLKVIASVEAETTGAKDTDEAMHRLKVIASVEAETAEHEAALERYKHRLKVIASVEAETNRFSRMPVRILAASRSLLPWRLRLLSAGKGWRGPQPPQGHCFRGG